MLYLKSMETLLLALICLRSLLNMTCYNRRNTIYGIPLSGDPEYDSFEGSSMGKRKGQLQSNIAFNTLGSNHDLHTILLFDQILEIDCVRKQNGKH